MSNPFSAKNKANKAKPTEVVEPDHDLEDAPSTELEQHHESPASAPEDVTDSNDFGAPSMTMEETSCRSCRFFEFEGESRKNVAQGECRRMAPSPGEQAMATWPSVKWDSWCGEWSSGINHEDMLRMARAVAESVGHSELDLEEEIREEEAPKNVDEAITI